MKVDLGLPRSKSRSNSEVSLLTQDTQAVEVIVDVVTTGAALKCVSTNAYARRKSV